MSDPEYIPMDFGVLECKLTARFDFPRGMIPDKVDRLTEAIEEKLYDAIEDLYIPELINIDIGKITIHL